MFKNYFKLAYRNLFNNKIFSTINITGLSIGMAAALLIFVWVQNELSFDHYHKDAERIYRMISHIDVGQDIWNWGSVPYPFTKVAEEEIPEIEELTKVRTLSETILKTETGDLVKVKNLAYADEKWLALFDYEIAEGDLATFQNNVYSIALTASQAEQLFGYKMATGQTIYMDSVAYSVDLILKDNPVNSVLQYNGFIPLKAYWANEKNWKNDQGWGNFSYQTFVKCKEGVNPKIVEEKLIAILDEKRTTKERKNNAAVSLEAMQDIRFSDIVDNDRYDHQNKSAVYIFMLIGLMLLLSASFNYVNLSTALINKRVKEIGVKKIIGASFKHIFSQVMIETFLISGLAIILAYGLAQFGLPFLQEITGLPIQIDLRGYHIWALLGGMLFLNVLVAGIYPAVLFAGFKPIRLISGKLLDQRGISLRKGLVVTQFVVAIAMMICTVIIYQQLNYIQEKNVGYDRSYVVDISPRLFGGDWRANYKKFGLFKDALTTVPEFEAITATDASLINIGNSGSGNLKWEGYIDEDELPLFRLSADESLLKVFSLEMQEGRWFQETLEMDKKNFILNETAAQMLNIPKPIVGAKVTHGGDEQGTIIGIVKDFHFKSMHQEIAPLLIEHNDEYSGTILAKVNGRTGQQALKKAETTFATFFPNIPFEYTFLDDAFEKLHESEAKMTLLFQIFAFLLLIISCLGLFGLATFAVERRTKEIGIRKVLGASTEIIVQLLARDFIKLVLVAVLIAIPLSWTAMQRWLENYAYRVEMQWWMFALAGVLTLVLAFMTVSIQSVKAALENPANVLKND